ncbi:MAG: GntR family transcriptional regulator [Oscillospiraceae bacterium]|nr:GntR family transcriptional regulator [Oscillospiraceae bacterium]
MPVPENYTAPVYLSAKERAFQQLQDWIIDGTLKPNEKLNDNELAKAIGVSRTPVREALQMLGYQGFVTMKPGVATTVNPVDVSDIFKILPLLAALSRLAVGLAVETAQPEDIAELRELNRAFASAIHDRDAFNSLKCDERFHFRIIAICDNSHLESMSRMLQAHVRRLFYLNSIVLSEESIGEHGRMIDALEARDKALAENIAEANWMRPMKTIQDLFPAET